MRWLGLGIVMTLFVAMTGGAFAASVGGWGLPGLLDKPISVRQGSNNQGRRGGTTFIYFGGIRRHYGGGYGYGK
ncbi:MAG: hypothetical protein JRH20_09405 [Deltaproteobacteria bacterium]|nr:hypothetical protein [Deltaproteobacteria bacterium]